MKITNLDNLKQYLKIPLSTVMRGHRIYESGYLNFEEGYLYTFGEVVTRTKLEYSGDIEENFFVSLDKFVLLVNSCDSLELSNKVFSSGKDTFELAHFTEDDIETPIFSDIINEERSVNFSASLIKDIKNSLYFIEPGLYAELDGVFIRDEHLIATNKVGFYDKFIPELEDMTLPLNVIKILTLLKDNHEIKMHSSNGKIQISIDDGQVEIKIPMSMNLNIPNTQSEGFINSYNHDTFLTVNRLELEEVFKFMIPFSKEQPSERTLIHVVDESTIQIKIMDLNKITKELTVNYCSPELVGLDFWISASMVRTALAYLTDAEVNIQVSPNNPATNFVGTSNKDLHIIISQIRQSED